MGSARNQVFELRPGEYSVGRGDDSKLVLPNVSVSNRHAIVKVTGENSVIEDWSSSNGTVVNGNTIQSHELQSGDEVRIGKFILIYLTDERKDQFYKGRCVRYLPPYEPRGVTATIDPVETFVLTKDALKSMSQQSRVMEDARILSEKDGKKFWHPEDRPLTFGSDSLIRVGGFLIWGTVAHIVWDGKAHVLQKKAFWVPVRINEVAVEKRALRHGDRIRIGDSRFKYETG